MRTRTDWTGLAIVIVMALIVVALTGCAAEPVQTKDPRLTELQQEQERLNQEDRVLQMRYTVRRSCRRITPIDRWPECDERAGL